ncbi:MAG: MBL fold metallo-hydrolase [Terriglobia bacterium]
MIRCRSLAIALFVASALVIGPAQSRALGRNYEVRQVGPHAFVWVPDDIMDQSGDPYFNRAGNVGFVITPEGVVVINTTDNPTHAREVLYEIRQRTDVPVRLVIDLGSEGDQVLGNEVFAEQRATIVSSTLAASGMRAYQAGFARRFLYDPELPSRMRGIHFAFPEQTFSGQTSYDVGGTQIRATVLNCGPEGRATGDAVVYLPQEKVLFLGDLYVKGFVPQVNGRDVERWVSALEELRNWDVTTYVPGHGAPGTRRDLGNFAGFLEWLRGGVESGIRQGKSLEQVQDHLLSSSAFNLLALDLAPRAIAEVYRQVTSKSAHVLPSRGTRPPGPHSREGLPLPPPGGPGFTTRQVPVPR